MQIMGSQDGEQQSHFQSLARQSSFYSLTLDEVNNQLGGLGKPLGSMNLDELLKNVWSAESNQAIGVDIESSPRTGQMAPASGLQRQGSVTINRTLSKKTVDEVWRDIQQGQDKNIKKRMAQERHPTFGEMTLEDFLVRAGALAEGSKMKGEVEHKGLNLSQEMCNVGPVASVDQMAGPQNYPQGQWLQYQYPQQSQPEQQNMMNAYVADHTVPQPLSISPTPLLDVSFPENQVTSLSPLMGTLSDTQTPGRKRVAPGDAVQKTVERRQKRMIKNRESAARSRARKQAYTNELENKVSRLEEENERLKKQKEVERILHCAPLPEPKYQLRRTSSAPF